MNPEIIDVIPPIRKAAVVNPFGISGSSSSAVKKIRIEKRMRKQKRKKNNSL